MIYSFFFFVLKFSSCMLYFIYNKGYGDNDEEN